MALIKFMNKLLSRRKLMGVIYFYFLLSDAANYVNCTKQKRQLFREQLLPEKGGKIPESAFHPERLFLNRLNQQGISVPDGVVLDQRRQEKHPVPKQHLPETLKVVLMSDGRYVAPPGRYHFEKEPTVDTTYVINLPYKAPHKGLLLNQWNNVRPPITYLHKHVDVSKWKPPIWFNEISYMLKNKMASQDYLDPSQILAEYSSYLQKIHQEYDK